MDISCAFATSMATPQHVAVAESLGYRRAWLFDSPAVYPDVWMILGECARATATIELGPGVAIPSLRHPMVTAAAIGTLECLAPGRVNVGFGSGFTGRLAMGQKPLRWSDVRTYVSAVRALLAGETIDWDGAPVRMLHPAGFAPARPITVPIYLGVSGPKGIETAKELDVGVVCVRNAVPGFPSSSVFTFGTVLDDDEEPGSDRAFAAAGHAGGVVYHGAYVRGTLANLPGGDRWLAAVEAFPERERHLAVHEGHLVEANARDRLVVTGETLLTFGITRTAAEWRDTVQHLGESGATEVTYQPAGPAIDDELRRFMDAVGGA